MREREKGGERRTRKRGCGRTDRHTPSQEQKALRPTVTGGIRYRGGGWRAQAMQGAGTEYAPESEGCCQRDRFLEAPEADGDRDQVSQRQLPYRRRRHPSRAETRAQTATDG